MALVLCAECKHEISDKAGRCPHCGAPIESLPPQPVRPLITTKPATGKQTIVVIAVVVFFAVIVAMLDLYRENSSSVASPQRSPPAEAVSKANATLEECKRIGVLLKDQNGFADIDRTWYNMTLDEKRQFALIYHIAHPGRFLLIRDGYSGKILATIDDRGRVDIKSD